MSPLALQKPGSTKTWYNQFSFYKYGVHKKVNLYSKEICTCVGPF